jgi:hypothetical protein
MQIAIISQKLSQQTGGAKTEPPCKMGRAAAMGETETATPLTPRLRRWRINVLAARRIQYGEPRVCEQTCPSWR